MIKCRGFILMELLVIIFLVTIISLSISTIVLNNNKNMILLKSSMKLDEIINNEAYRVKSNLEPKIYEDYTVECIKYLENSALGLKGIDIEYIEIIVKHNKYEIKKTVTVVRGVTSE